MERTVAEARERGYTETLFGRRRPIPELSSSNFRIRQAGERQAMNAGIQGLAADIFKVALVRLDHELEAQELGSRLILQVHYNLLNGGGPGGVSFAGQVALWLWFTVLFASFAEAMAEGRGKAQADELRKTRRDTTARRLRDDGTTEVVPASQLASWLMCWTASC